MQKKPFITAILLPSFLSCICLAYNGGSGREDDPYHISAVAGWQQLMDTSTDWDKHFILTADLDLQGVALTPVGSSGDHSFSGVFDGNGHIIRNAGLDLPDSDYVGLFGFLGSGGEVRDLGVEDVNITGDQYVGGLVGLNDRGTLTCCYATGEVTGGRSVGGLVGENGGMVTACYATGQVTGGGWDTGGLVGTNGDWDFPAGGTLTCCYATGQVTGDRYVGGLVGSNWRDSTLTACYATGQVTGNLNVGGLVGRSGMLTGCFWNTETTRQPGSGGGKGLTTEQMKTMHIFQNAGWSDYDWVMQERIDYPRLVWENTGGISIPAPEPVPLAGSGTHSEPYQIWTAADFALLSWYSGILDKHIILMTDLDLTGVELNPIGDLGPFMGIFDGNGHIIRNAVIDLPGSDGVGLFGCFGSGGEVRDLGVEDVNITGHWRVGGLVGDNGGTLTSCYATGQVTGDQSVGGLVGLNDHGTLTCCYAAGEVTGGGSVGGLLGFNDEGTLTSCYAKGAVSGSYDVGGLVGHNYYDYYAATLTSCYATGVVSGSYHVGGLVGYNGGTLTSCYATGQVTGGWYVGGLVGYNGGTVTSCYATGQVNGTGWNVGGLVGQNNGTLTSCYATGEVMGDYQDAGGLVGRNTGTLTSCYATGRVTGEVGVGGLVGENGGTLTSCYATGQMIGDWDVGGLVGWGWSNTVIACFWDTETSGETSSDGGEGRTTAQMQDINTFLDAGWDFIGERTNGSDDIWKMTCEGMSYPKLTWWQPVLGDYFCPDGVDMIDLAYLTEYWLAESDESDRADLNGDAAIKFDDFAILADNWLAGK